MLIGSGVILDCGGKRSATPLWRGLTAEPHRPSESAVAAAALPAQSMTRLGGRRTTNGGHSGCAALCSFAAKNEERSPSGAKFFRLLCATLKVYGFRLEKV